MLICAKLKASQNLPAEFCRASMMSSKFFSDMPLISFENSPSERSSGNKRCHIVTIVTG